MPTPTDPTVPEGVYSRREDDVIERIAQIVGQVNIPAGERHIGDDAAVLAPFVGQAVISTDVAVLGVHLDFEYFPLEDLGFKAVAAAVSDLAAMGARPRGAVVAVTAPPGTDLEELHRGMADASIVTGCPIVGGDLARGRDVTVAVTVFGECPGRARSCEAAPGWEMNCSSRAPRAFGGGSSPTPGRGLALGRIGVAHRRPGPASPKAWPLAGPARTR